MAALGRLLGSRQDVPYPEKENVHYYNNINKSGPEDGASPEGAASVREEEAEPAPEEEEDDDIVIENVEDVRGMKRGGEQLKDTQKRMK